MFSRHKQDDCFDKGVNNTNVVSDKTIVVDNPLDAILAHISPHAKITVRWVLP